MWIIHKILYTSDVMQTALQYYINFFLFFMILHQIQAKFILLCIFAWSFELMKMTISNTSVSDTTLNEWVSEWKSRTKNAEIWREGVGSWKTEHYNIQWSIKNKWQNENSKYFIYLYLCVYDVWCTKSICFMGINVMASTTESLCRIHVYVLHQFNWKCVQPFWFTGSTDSNKQSPSVHIIIPNDFGREKEIEREYGICYTHSHYTN